MEENNHVREQTGQTTEAGGGSQASDLTIWRRGHFCHYCNPVTRQEASCHCHAHAATVFTSDWSDCLYWFRFSCGAFFKQSVVQQRRSQSLSISPSCVSICWSISLMHITSFIIFTEPDGDTVFSSPNPSPNHFHLHTHRFLSFTKLDANEVCVCVCFWGQLSLWLSNIHCFPVIILKFLEKRWEKSTKDRQIGCIHCR